MMGRDSFAAAGVGVAIAGEAGEAAGPGDSAPRQAGNINAQPASPSQIRIDDLNL